MLPGWNILRSYWYFRVLVVHTQGQFSGSFKLIRGKKCFSTHPNVHIKGIFSDFNNIFLWHESEDVHKKSLFPKFQLIPILRFHAWLCVFHFSHRLLCWIKSHVWDFLWKLLSFHTKMVSAQFLWGGVLLRGELRKYAKN